MISITDFPETLDQVPLVKFFREFNGKMASRSVTKGFSMVTVPNPCPYNAWSIGSSSHHHSGHITAIISEFYGRYNNAYARILHPEALQACLSLIYIATQNGKTSQLFHLHDGLTSVVEIKLKGRDGSEEAFKSVGEFRFGQKKISKIYDEKLQKCARERSMPWTALGKSIGSLNQFQ